MLLFICYSSDFSAYIGILSIALCFLNSWFGIQDYFKSSILFTIVVKMRDPFYMQLLLHKLFQKLFSELYVFLYV